MNFIGIADVLSYLKKHLPILTTKVERFLFSA